MSPSSMFARRTIGWRTSSSVVTDFVLDAPSMPVHGDHRNLVHRSDRGT